MSVAETGDPASLWRRCVLISLPLLSGYVPIGIGFGVLWVQHGLPAWGAPLLSLIVYAGAAQFMAAAMLAAGQGPVEIALATLVLNARHLVYGLAFLDRFPGWTLAKGYFAFSLTDETYAVLVGASGASGETPPEAVLWRVALLNQVYWVTGTVIGAAAGGFLGKAVPGLDFVLSALFIVLLLDQMRTRQKAVAAVIAGSVALVGTLLLGTANTLLPVLALALIAVTLHHRFHTR